VATQRHTDADGVAIIIRGPEELGEGDKVAEIPADVEAFDKLDLLRAQEIDLAFAANGEGLDPPASGFGSAHMVQSDLMMWSMASSSMPIGTVRDSISSVNS